MSAPGVIDGLLQAHTSAGGGRLGDYTAALALAGGAVLVALAIPFLHPGEGTTRRGRPWASRAAAALAGSLLIYAAVYPIAQLVGTHEHRQRAGDLPAASDRPMVTSIRTPYNSP